ncbi:MAG TPA: efflux RND transporter periplasmic adaptor subunit [Candidatus Dormibacteraeota bacterium]|nr:efflux RND transporter periplasmic adaptor subunit [Candidatus Dormibacteraeota bacterium]
MKNYRKAFYIALTANLLLAGLVVGVWSYERTPRTTRAPESPAEAPPASTKDGRAMTAAPMETPLAPLQLSPERLQTIGVEFGAVARRPVSDEIRTTGNVAVDETQLSYVQTRFAGYIEKVFADATYQYVRRGQPLFTIYSPELAAAEREYLIAKKDAQNLSKSTVPGVASGIESLVSASADRLGQWNLPPREVARLESTGQVQQSLEIDSPVAGFITERNALPNLTVQPDTRLYTIANLSTVWVFAQVFQDQLGQVHAGEKASLTVDSYPGRAFHGQVDFVYPDVDMTTRTARVRLVFPNPKLTLTPGMFVNVDLNVPLGEQLTIPATGVLQTGTREIVFVDRGDGYLQPRDVQLGEQAGNEYVVLEGLKAGERIVTSANFLIDSESQLQAALGSFTPPPPGAGAAAAMNASQGHVEFTSDPNPPHKGSNMFRVKLTDGKGAAIPGAQMTVTFFMPAMPAMGMAAMRTVVKMSDKGNGVYEGSGQLGSGGTWQVTITARKNGQVIVSKQLSVNATGGM